MQGRAWRGVDRLGVRVPEEVINWSTDDTDRCPFDVLVVHVQDSRLNCHESYKRRELSWVVTDDQAVVELWPLCQRSCTLLSNISFCHQLWWLEKRLLCQSWGWSIGFSWSPFWRAIQQFNVRRVVRSIALVRWTHPVSSPPPTLSDPLSARWWKAGPPLLRRRQLTLPAVNRCNLDLAHTLWLWWPLHLQSPHMEWIAIQKARSKCFSTVS